MYVRSCVCCTYVVCVCTCLRALGCVALICVYVHRTCVCVRTCVYGVVSIHDYLYIYTHLYELVHTRVCAYDRVCCCCGVTSTRNGCVHIRMHMCTYINLEYTFLHTGCFEDYSTRENCGLPRYKGTYYP